MPQMLSELGTDIQASFEVEIFSLSLFYELLIGSTVIHQKLFFA